MLLRRILALTALTCGLLPGRAADLNVYAAASLAEALGEIARTYQAPGGEKLRFNLGASSTLALQIRQGAPADVFFSADEAKMDDLVAANLIAAETRRSLLSNTLVIIVNADRSVAVAGPADLRQPAVRRIALADPELVPAGIYARSYLQSAGLWATLSSRVVAVENVRACLAAVEAGNADAGIVYKTDALIAKRVQVVFEVSVADSPSISYPVAMVKASRRPDSARQFIAHVGSPEALAVFTRHGFLLAR